MNWIKKCKIPTIEVIQYNGKPYIELDDLWQTLHLFFNSAQNCQIDSQLLEEIPGKKIMIWDSFSKEEFIGVIKKYNNSSTPGPDKLSWRHLKRIVKDIIYLNRIIDITNAYIDIGHWLLHFKCYDPMLKVLSKELTLVLSDTRELDRVSNTK